MTATGLDPAILVALCDDAAVFPPGNVPLEQAVPAHLRHRQSEYAALAGPFVLAARDLGGLSRLVRDLPEKSLELALTVPLPQVTEAVAAARRIRAVRLVALEIAVPDTTVPERVLPRADGLDGIAVSVEVPRDARRDGVLRTLSGTGHQAKFRTGGVRADLYPDEPELADTIRAAVHAGVPFKATAGLHHALRNTDPATGFEQHGFLNLLAAAGAAMDGAARDEVIEILRDRDGAAIAGRVLNLRPQVRTTFRSFGTCSIVEPVRELVDLGLLPSATGKDLR